MNNLTQPTTETENYNETILIPILHKKINQLTAENLLLEAQVQILDKEKKALQLRVMPYKSIIRIKKMIRIHLWKMLFIHLI